MKKLITLICTAILCSGAFASGHIVTITNTNVSCNGLCDGTATATVTGGVGPFAYSWSNGITTHNQTNLCAGSYTVTVTDTDDMSTASATVTISEPTALTISLPPSYSVCAGGSVTFNAVATGGTPAYTYTWNNAGILSAPNISNPVCTPITSTTFTLTVSDMNGCAYTATTVVMVMPSVTATVTATAPSDCGLCDGTASVMPVGGTAPYSYSWPSGPSGGPASSLCAGSYTVTTTDANGCTATNTFSLLDPAPTANYTIIPDSADGYTIHCFNSSASAYSIWDFGDGTNSTDVSPIHVYTAPGTYMVTLQAISAASCGDTVSQSVVITGTPASCLALFHIAADTISGNPNSYTIYNLSYGASLSYAWDFGDGTTSTLAHPSHVYATSSGPYQICLMVDNGSGCTQTYCDSIFSVDSIGRTTDPISFTVVDGTPSPVITGIAEQSATASVSVSPNPFNDNATFVIQSDANETYSFEMTDVLGKTVRSVSGITDKQFNVSRSGLQNGVYFYKIYSAENSIGQGKLIIR